MSANIRETYTAVSKRRQTDLVTPNLEAHFIRFTSTNNALAEIEQINETDADELGKGDEFARTDYPSHLSMSVTREMYLKAEMMAWAAAMGLGNVVKSGSAPNLTYTCTPSVPLSAGIDLPAFSYAEAIRPGASPAWHDAIFTGCVLNSFSIALASGPGRESSKLTVEIVGTGRYTEPSGLDFDVMPLVETPLPAYGATINILGTNYTSAGRIVSLNFTWNNNVRLDSGYFPGSGKQGNHQVRGRMEHGDRSCTLDFVARMAAGQAERAALSSMATGTAVITIPFDANNEVTITCHKVSFSQAQPGEADGIVTVNGTLSVKRHTTNGLLTIVAKCNLDDIFALP